MDGSLPCYQRHPGLFAPDLARQARSSRARWATSERVARARRFSQQDLGNVSTAQGEEQPVTTRAERPSCPPSFSSPSYGGLNASGPDVCSVTFGCYDAEDIVNAPDGKLTVYVTDLS